MIFPSPAVIKVAVIGALGAVVLAGLTGVVVGLYAYTHGKDVEGNAKQVIINRMVADAALAARQAADAYRAMEANWRTKLQEAEHARDQERQQVAAALAELARARTERDGLRDQLASYATGGRDAAADTVAACRVRAETLGVLLEAGVRVQEEIAAGAEAASTDLRAVLAAWPQQLSDGRSPAEGEGQRVERFISAIQPAAAPATAVLLGVNAGAPIPEVLQ